MDRRTFIKTTGTAVLLAPVLVKEALAAREQSLVAVAEGVDCKQIEPERFRKVTLNGQFLKEWELYDEALSANVYINVPVAKHHGLSKLTLGLKNVMGIMGGNRGYIHRNLAVALADVNAHVKSHLTIIDATRILTAHGPQGGQYRRRQGA